MTFKAGNFKVTITVKKGGGIVIVIEPWKRKGGLIPPAKNNRNGIGKPLKNKQLNY